ncbi:phosphotransferase family protein [Annulohypoxylon moriforme]|nr:phosphotransferase family protein [Annulohypoxylon moriforme]
MPSRSRPYVAAKDDIVWRKLEEFSDQWNKSLHNADLYRAVARLILKYKDGDGVELKKWKGGYNVVYRLEYKDGSSVMMRVPMKDLVPFPYEKIRYEVATMRYVAANTTIPVPHIYHCGTAAENPTGLGPFIIMDYIEHDYNMSRVLLDPTLPPDQSPILDPNINEEKLEYIYAQMANVLLQLSTLKFPRIGSLEEEEDGKTISVKGRPLTWNMNDIIVHTNAPKSILPEPSRTYATEDEWLNALADMHMVQISFQHNDAAEDEDDARDKYVSRQLFRNLVKEKRLFPRASSKPDDRFRLFSEDFRPANVLLDKDLKIVGVIDWEFAYAAPARFIYDPPWWLLIERAEHWSGGYDAWMEIYEPRFQTFLRMLEAEEKKMADANLAEKVNSLTLTDNDNNNDNKEMMEIPLSQRMRESWEKRTWMISSAATKSWNLDYLWWHYLDEDFFGPNEDHDHKIRVELLSEPQKKVMESFVARKIEDGKDGEKVNFGDEDPPDLVNEFLV